MTFQEVILDQELTGRQILDFHGQLYGQPRPERNARIGELAELVELTAVLDRKAAGYSGGMKRRLELARGLMTRPQILFLDEPTQGLDPQNRAGIWRHIQRLRGETGLTLLLTTHYMEEADALADRVGIIDRGQLIVEGAPAELKRAMGADVVTLCGYGDAPAYLRLLEAEPYVSQAVEHSLTQSAVGDNEGVECDQWRLQIGVDSGDRRLARLLALAAEPGLHVSEVSVSRPSLADVFLAHTGRALRTANAVPPLPHNQSPNNGERRCSRSPLFLDRCRGRARPASIRFVDSPENGHYVLPAEAKRIDDHAIRFCLLGGIRDYRNVDLRIRRIVDRRRYPAIAQRQNRSHRGLCAGCAQAMSEHTLNGGDFHPIYQIAKSAFQGFGLADIIQSRTGAVRVHHVDVLGADARRLDRARQSPRCAVAVRVRRSNVESIGGQSSAQYLGIHACATRQSRLLALQDNHTGAFPADKTVAINRERATGALRLIGARKAVPSARTRTW